MKRGRVKAVYRTGMAVAVSLGVAAFSFIIGYFIRIWLGIEV